VEAPGRAAVARFLAPAAVLLAVTIAVLLVRAGLNGGDDAASTRPLTAPVERTVTTQTTTPKKKRPARRFYTIQSGDTLDIVAARFGTTTERLLALNPGIDPHALTVGQRVRVA
jgi:LysM repeat protein